jgi:hypothetical protein
MLLTLIENNVETYINYGKGVAFDYKTLQPYSKGIHEFRSLTSELYNCLHTNYEHYRAEYFELVIEKGKKEEAEKMRNEDSEQEKVS